MCYDHVTVEDDIVEDKEQEISENGQEVLYLHIHIVPVFVFCCLAQSMLVQNWKSVLN